MKISYEQIGREIGKIILASIIIVFLGCGILYFYSAKVLADLQKRGEQDKVELKIIFSKAILDGTVIDPPTPATAFTITSRHGNAPYIVSFTNSVGQRTGYFVSKNDLWEFKSLLGPPHTFARELQNKK